MILHCFGHSCIKSLDLIKMPESRFESIQGRSLLLHCGDPNKYLFLARKQIFPTNELSEYFSRLLTQSSRTNFFI